jgi:hypothetical protein
MILCAITPSSDGVADQLRQLSPAERNSLIAAAFERRLKQCDNVEFVVRSVLKVYKLNGTQLGDVKDTLCDETEHMWRLGSSYRVDTERTADAGKVRQALSNHYDAGAGVSRSVVATTRMQTGARIDTTPDRQTQEFRYQYWLDGQHTNLAEYIFRYLLDHKGEFSSEVRPDGLVALTVPWAPRWSKTPLGTREFVLDPAKGFMPVSGKGRWEQPKPTGPPNWRSEEFTADEAKLVGDVWMPMRLREVIHSSNGTPGTVNVWETAVDRIELGRVAPADLEVTFPKGTQVVDAIKGVTYHVGEDGQPTKMDRVYGAAPPSPQAIRDARPATAWRWVLIGLSNLVGVGLLVWVGRRYIRRRPA